MRREPHEHTIKLRLTFHGQDAIDLQAMAKLANVSCSAMAKTLLCAVLKDDRAAHGAHEEEERAA